MKNVFDKKLYTEGLRQLRTMGSVWLILFVLEAILVPVGRLVNLLQRGTQVADLENYRNLELLGIHPAILLLFSMVVPVLTLYLFRFLNHRASSDFYHSIPQTRTCLFVSFSAAVMTWTLAIHWISLAVDMIAHSFLLGAGTMMIGKILFESISIDLICILVMAAILIAMSVTGTIFANVIVTGLILFAPRLVMLLIQMGVGESLMVVESEYLFDFLGNDWNMLTGFLLWGFTGSGEWGTDVLVHARPIVYTLVLTAAYLAAGGFLFGRRKSEVAGQNANGPFLQLVFRLVPAFIFCMIPNMTLFNKLAKGRYVTVSDWYLLFILYLISVVLYFLLELVTTRKLRNLVKAVPGLAVLVILNVAMVSGMLGIRSHVLDYAPKADEIESVTFETGSRYIYTTGVDQRLEGYFSSRVNRVELTEPEMIKLVSDGLKEAIQMDQSVYAAERNYDTIPVIINAGGKVRHRNIVIYAEEMVSVASALRNNEQVYDIYMNLPAAEDSGIACYCSELSNEDAAAVYEELRKDAVEMGFEDWYAYCSDTSFETYLFGKYGEKAASDYLVMNYISLVVTDQMDVTGAYIPVSTATPRAAKKLLEVKSEADLDEYAPVIRLLERVKADPAGLEEYGGGYCDGSVYRITDGELSDWYSGSADLTKAGTADFLIRLLERQTAEQKETDRACWFEMNLYLEYDQPTDQWNGVNLSTPLYVPEDMQEEFAQVFEPYLY